MDDSEGSSNGSRRSSISAQEEISDKSKDITENFSPIRHIANQLAHDFITMSEKLISAQLSINLHRFGIVRETDDFNPRFFEGILEKYRELKESWDEDCYERKEYELTLQYYLENLFFEKCQKDIEACSIEKYRKDVPNICYQKEILEAKAKEALSKFIKKFFFITPDKKYRKHLKRFCELENFKGLMVFYLEEDEKKRAQNYFNVCISFCLEEENPGYFQDNSFEFLTGETSFLSHLYAYMESGTKFLLRDEAIQEWVSVQPQEDDEISDDNMEEDRFQENVFSEGSDERKQLSFPQALEIFMADMKRDVINFTESFAARSIEDIFTTLPGDNEAQDQGDENSSVSPPKNIPIFPRPISNLQIQQISDGMTYLFLKMMESVMKIESVSSPNRTPSTLFFENMVEKLRAFRKSIEITNMSPGDAGRVRLDWWGTHGKTKEEKENDIFKSRLKERFFKGCKDDLEGCFVDTGTADKFFSSFRNQLNDGFFKLIERFFLKNNKEYQDHVEEFFSWRGSFLKKENTFMWGFFCLDEDAKKHLQTYLVNRCLCEDDREENPYFLVNSSNLFQKEEGFLSSFFSYVEATLKFLSHFEAQQTLERWEKEPLMHRDPYPTVLLDEVRYKMFEKTEKIPEMAEEEAGSFGKDSTILIAEMEREIVNFAQDPEKTKKMEDLLEIPLCTGWETLAPELIHKIAEYLLEKRRPYDDRSSETIRYENETSLITFFHLNKHYKREWEERGIVDYIRWFKEENETKKLAELESGTDLKKVFIAPSLRNFDQNLRSLKALKTVIWFKGMRQDEEEFEDIIRSFKQDDFEQLISEVEKSLFPESFVFSEGRYYGKLSSLPGRILECYYPDFSLGKGGAPHKEIFLTFFDIVKVFCKIQRLESKLSEMRHGWGRTSDSVRAALDKMKEVRKDLAELEKILKFLTCDSNGTIKDLPKRKDFPHEMQERILQKKCFREKGYELMCCNDIETFFSHLEKHLSVLNYHEKFLPNSYVLFCRMISKNFEGKPREYIQYLGKKSGHKVFGDFRLKAANTLTQNPQRTSEQCQREMVSYLEEETIEIEEMINGLEVKKKKAQETIEDLRTKALAEFYSLKNEIEALKSYVFEGSLPYEGDVFLSLERNLPNQLKERAEREERMDGTLSYL